MPSCARGPATTSSRVSFVLNSIVGTVAGGVFPIETSTIGGTMMGSCTLAQPAAARTIIERNRHLMFMDHNPARNIGPVLVVPVSVTAVVDSEVANVVAKPDVESTTGVFVNATGNVYEAVPFRAARYITTIL